MNRSNASNRSAYKRHGHRPTYHDNQITDTYTNPAPTRRTVAPRDRVRTEVRGAAQNSAVLSDLPASRDRRAAGVGTSSHADEYARARTYAMHGRDAAGEGETGGAQVHDFNEAKRRREERLRREQTGNEDLRHNAMR
ncbi:MAG TPA: hypothetical protein VF719_00060, partial [Abditibacteriaceae bacterium]